MCIGWVENSHVDEWSDQNYSSKMAGNNLPGNGSNQWSGNESSWNNNVVSNNNTCKLSCTCTVHVLYMYM